MSVRKLFMDVPHLGELYIQDVLVAYIYPRVFICQDNQEHTYLLYEMDSPENKDVWLVSNITKDDYCNLVGCEKSIQEVYEEKDDYELFSITKTYGEKDTVEITMNGKELLSHLPKQPVYAERDSSEVVYVRDER